MGQHVCQPLHSIGLAATERNFASIVALVLIGLANAGLFNHLIVISGNQDPNTPYTEHIAVLISSLLFACLIFAYGILYFIHLPCMHYIYQDRSGWHRVAADFTTSAYFSTITITTLGYGDFSPKNYLFGEMIAALQAVNGLVAFGVFTGALAGFIAKR